MVGKGAKGESDCGCGCWASARFAYVDHKAQEGEFDSKVSAIQSNWNLSDLEAALVAEAAVSTNTK